MNSVIKQMLDNESPKISTLDEKEKKLYKAGLGILGTIISSDFFDLPRLSTDKYSKDGVFYSIPFYDDTQLWACSNKRMLLIVYHIYNRGSWCPFRIDFEFTDTKNFRIIAYDQSGQRTIPSEFIACVNSEWFTQIENHNGVKLSELVSNEIV
jgi:hypothetical protein